MRRVCSNGWGYVKPENRWTMEQVSMEIDTVHYTMNPIYDGDSVGKSMRNNLTKRVVTLQVCVRDRGEQSIPLTTVMGNHNPNQDRYEFPKNLQKRTLDFENNGIKRREDYFYDNRVDVMWDQKTCMSEQCTEQWFTNSFDKTKMFSFKNQSNFLCHNWKLYNWFCHSMHLYQIIRGAFPIAICCAKIFLYSSSFIPFIAL